MLIPKRTKYRKQFRGKIGGVATKGNNVDFGEYGLAAKEFIEKNEKMTNDLLESKYNAT